MKANYDIPRLIQLFLVCGLIGVALTAGIAIQKYGKIRTMEQDMADSVQVINH